MIYGKIDHGASEVKFMEQYKIKLALSRYKARSINNNPRYVWFQSIAVSNIRG